MKCLRLLLLSTIFLGESFAQSRLVWRDEFDGPANAAPDAKKWTYDLGAGGWGNKELQTYTDAIENAHLDGQGRLVIRALRSKDGGFTSARLKTAGKFEGKYLRVTARMKVPKGQGLWAALWMLGATFPAEQWPACGEIDIMEHIGKEPSSTYGTVHGPGYSGKNGPSGKRELARNVGFGDSFHEYSVEWRPGEISFFVDGSRFHTVHRDKLPAGTRWVFDRPFFIIVNLAVGGEWPGDPDVSTQFPAVFEIDWIRAYRLQ
jgi:beta-glucanase (GH16 family)